MREDVIDRRRCWDGRQGLDASCSSAGSSPGSAETMACSSLSCPSLSCPFQALDSAFFWWQLLVEDLVWVSRTVGLAFPLLNAAVILFCYRFPLVANRRGKSHLQALLCPCDTSETADVSADGDGGFSPGPSIRASQRGFQSSSRLTGRLEPVRGLGLGLPVAS